MIRSMSTLPQSDRERIAELTRAMLDRSGSPAFSFWQELAEMMEIVQAAAGFAIDPHQEISDGESRSCGGLALSPIQAAMCSDDAQRTITFMRGLFQAVSDLLDAEGLQPPVRVLYAGSGPFASLALPLMALLSPEQVRFTILDLHEESLACVRTLVDRLGFADHVEAIELADACTFRIGENTADDPDIVLSETMNVGLEAEPQVMIARNLMAQAPQAVMIPQAVAVNAKLIDQAKEFTFSDPGQEEDEAGAPREVADIAAMRDHVDLGTVIELSKEAIEGWAELGDVDYLPASSVQMPATIDARYTAHLCTEVTVYGDQVLRIHDCGLSVPKPFPFPDGARGAEAGGAAFNFRYRLGTAPGLECEERRQER